jgi:hypothetical protein
MLIKRISMWKLAQYIDHFRSVVENFTLAYEEVELSMLHYLIIDLLVTYTFQSLLQLKASPFRAGGGQSETRIKLSKNMKMIKYKSTDILCGLKFNNERVIIKYLNFIYYILIVLHLRSFLR